MHPTVYLLCFYIRLIVLCVSVLNSGVWTGVHIGQRRPVAPAPGLHRRPRCAAVHPAASLPQEPPFPAHQQQRREQGQKW